jgi:hypothetical protein
MPPGKAALEIHWGAARITALTNHKAEKASQRGKATAKQEFAAGQPRIFQAKMANATHNGAFQAALRRFLSSPAHCRQRQ